MILANFELKKTISVLFFIFVLAFSAQISLASTIAGFVYGPKQVPLVDVDVELLNENYQLRGRARTDGSGRYEFGGLTDGVYTIRAMPFRYGFVDQQAKVEVRTMSVRGAGIGNSYVNQDFYLAPKKGGIAEYELGVIFAQDVPREAQAAYKNADKNLLNDRKQEGVEELFKAIKVFPEYYDALYRMGKELYSAGKYEDSWQFLLKATQVNPKSGVAYYYLGESFSKLGKDYNKAAITSLTHASTLIPNMPQVFYTLGKAERAAGKFKDAEQHLLQAKKLADRPIPEIQKELAQLYGNDLKKYKEAAEELELYLKASKLSKDEEKIIKEKIFDLKSKSKS